MAFTTMHFATGMACTGLAFGAGCLVLRRGWKWLPLAMTAGGLWAIVPDMPRIWREDFPSLPLASTLGAKELERWLHSIGDIFFFHKRLDAQPQEYALHGLILILLCYNAAVVMLMWLNWRASKTTRRLEQQLQLTGSPTRTRSTPQVPSPPNPTDSSSDNEQP